jgi:hypothetical protein
LFRTAATTAERTERAPASRRARGAGVEGGAGGADVVDEQDVASAHVLGAPHEKRAGQIGEAVGPVERRLLRGVANAGESTRLPRRAETMGDA